MLFSMFVSQSNSNAEFTLSIYMIGENDISIILFQGLTGTSRTCSSLCIHPWNKKRPSDHTTTQKSEDDDLAILQILIEAKEKSVLQYE